METFDVVVIGAGFGGLGAALTLAERGARVLQCEALAYPGGCASTFTRKGYRFEAGATLSSGFAPGQLFHRWREEHQLPLHTTALTPVIRFRSPHGEIAVPPTRDALVAHLCALPGAPVEGLRRFFDLQGRAADALWGLFDDPSLLPPFGLSALTRHLSRSLDYLPLLGLLGQPLAAVLARYGIADFQPFRAWVDGLCQITVQAPAAEAEAAFALATMDYNFRGVAHIDGGIGELAWALTRAVERKGGAVWMAHRVKQLRREGGAWVVQARGREVKARFVVGNVLPQAVEGLVGEPVPALAGRAAAVEEGWGAAMLYLGLGPLSAPEPFHLEGVVDPRAPFQEGNHLFVSVSEERERRVATVSTHLPMKHLRGLSPEEQAAYVARVQAAMRANLAVIAPEVAAAVVTEMTASPRTFARFTGRPYGYVGGIPRRAGLHNYRDFLPAQPLPGFYLVGDSVFPGQSTLATAIGGLKAAQAILAQR